MNAAPAVMPVATPTPARLVTVVLGLGHTGLSVARYLHCNDYPLCVVDTRAQPPMAKALAESLPDVEVLAGGWYAERLRSAARIVVSPGVSRHEPALVAARRAGAEIVGDIELFARAAAAPVIAITGSNGKSTVTALAGELARAAGRAVLVGGNIGTPALDLLAAPAPDLYVLELSSFQLETTCSLRPLAATVLDLSPDHMDRYADLGAYGMAKARIFRGARSVVLNRDQAAIVALAGGTEAAVSFGRDAPPGGRDFGVASDPAGPWLMQGERRLLQIDTLALAGGHNAMNVLAALALVDAAGIELDAAVLAAARAFTGLPHRCELLGEWCGVTWINDSKATNVGATLAALTGMSRPVVLIAGGLGKGADFSLLRGAVASHARAVVLFGRDAPAMEGALSGAAAVVQVADLAAAVGRAAALARPGDVVMLSPACASFDMFDNFEARGAAFRQLVEARQR